MMKHPEEVGPQGPTSATATEAVHPPPAVLWAQRANQLLLTIDIEDCKNPTIKLEKDKLYFKGKSDSIQNDHDHNDHEVTLEFHKPINVEESKHVVKARGIEFIIVKEQEGWWPRLLKNATKRHWLKIDFTKWKDEDDTDDEMSAGGGGFGGGNLDFGDFMQQFGGMAGAGGFPGEEDGEDVESDDDDTEQPPPDLE